MDDLDSAQLDADTNGFSLIDASASSDDDFLLASSSDCDAVDYQGAIFTEGAHVDKPSDLLAIQRPRKGGKCNLRKSLAWDSAFFTSSGVLDAEELSSIMEGAETGPKQDHLLPGIQEELSKSTDSINTFESDSLTLESLEADLFCDIRASIQRSSSKSSNSGNNNGERESGNECSLKIAKPSVGNMVKPKLPSRKLNPAVQVPTRMLKPSSSSKQVTKPVVRGRDSSSNLPRPPVATGKPRVEGPPQSKRMSVEASRAKSEIFNERNTKGAGKDSPLLKRPSQVDSRNIVRKAPPSSKLSASSILDTSAMRSSRSSYDSCSSSSSENIRKSQINVVRRKIDKVSILPPGSKVRTPSRVPVKSKSQPGESQLSAYVKSTSKLSPSISPASSISEWSAESSSSTAAVNQKHGGLKYCSTPEDFTLDSNVSPNMRKPSNDRSLDRHDPQVASMVSQSSKQPSTGSTMSLARPGSAKPSGLRLPSPKIGFFDGAKAGTKTPGGTARPRSALHSNLPRSVAGNCSSSGPANKAKPGSLAVRVSTSTASTAKLDPQKNHASPKLTKEVHIHSMDLPSGSDVGAFSELPIPTLAKSALEINGVVAKVDNGGEQLSGFDSDARNNSSHLTKGSVAMIVHDTSGTSIELPKATSTKSALEKNYHVSEEVGGGKHYAEVSLMGKDQSEVLKLSSAQESDDEPNTSSELKCFSSIIERDREVAEVTKGEEYPANCGLVLKDKEALDSDNGEVETKGKTCAEYPEEESEQSVETSVLKIDVMREPQISLESETILKNEESHLSTILSCPKESQRCTQNELSESVMCSPVLPDMGVGQEGGSEKHVETSDHKTDVVREPQISLESETVLKNEESHLSTTSLSCPEKSQRYTQNEVPQSVMCSPLLPDMAVSQTEETEKHVMSSDHKTDVMREPQISLECETILMNEEIHLSTIVSCPEELKRCTQNELSESVMCFPLLPDMGVGQEEEPEQHVETSDHKSDVVREPQISLESETVLKNEESHFSTTILSCPEESQRCTQNELSESVMCSPVLPDMGVGQEEGSEKHLETSDHKTDVVREPQISLESETVLKNEESHFSTTILSCPEESQRYTENEVPQSVMCSPLLPDMGVSQLEESEKHVMTSDHKTDVMREPQISLESETILNNEEIHLSTILSCPEESQRCTQNELSESVMCSPLLPDIGVGQEEESEKHVETSGHKTDVVREPQISFESETILKNEGSHSSTILSCAEELPGYKQNESAQFGMCCPLLSDMVVSQVEESEKHAETLDRKTDMVREPHINFESETILRIQESHSSVILSCSEELPGYKQNKSAEFVMCSPLSPDTGVGQGTRTPFAVKNHVFDVVDVSNSSPVSVSETFLRADDVPSLEKDQKENS